MYGRAMTDFTKTLIWLMDSFSGIQFRLNAKYVIQVMNKLVPYYSFADILEAEPVEAAEENVERLLESLLMITDLHYWLISLGGKPLTAEELESVRTQLILSNSSLTEYLRSSPSWNDNSSTKEIRQLGDTYVELLNVLVRDRTSREFLQRGTSQEDFLNAKCYKRVAKSDVHMLETHIEYLQLILVWMCIIESPFYDTTAKEIARGLVETFCDLFSNSRIEEMYMEPNFFYSEVEQGTHTTTKWEIFFVQSNGDRYCLRLDFPHFDVDFVRFNLHEPFREVAFPIAYDEYCDLTKESKILLRDFFYSYGNRKWFRNDFEHLVQDKLSDNNLAANCLLRKYDEQRHYPFLENRYVEADINRFLGLMFEAVSAFDMTHSLYKKPKEIDVNEHFQLITLRESVRMANYAIDNNYINARINPEKVDRELESAIKKRITEALTDYLGKYKPSELEDCSVEELLELIETEING